MEEPPQYIKVDIITKNGQKRKQQVINSDWVKYQLALEDCIMLDPIRRGSDKFRYEYKGKIFKTTWSWWQKEGRNHLGINPDGYDTYCEIVSSPNAYSSTMTPDWFKNLQK